MMFSEAMPGIPLDALMAESLGAGSGQVDQAVGASSPGLREMAWLLSPAAAGRLELLGQRSQALTRQRFGRAIRLFAPLYVSNECINNCSYCGFSRDNPILRVTLSLDQVRQEARELHRQGFRHLLVVAGEHPKFVSNGYLESCIATLHEDFPSVSLEVGPMTTEEYRPLVAAGAEGLVVYQETYDRAMYGSMHTAGPKRDYDYRLDTPERAYAAGFRRLGLGALLGLSDWRAEALALAAHTRHLLRSCWKAQITVSFPRLRPCAGEFEPLQAVDDRSLAQLICAFRIVFPDVGIVLSTREPAPLRDGLMGLGVTMMSAGSHTEPGGYTGTGRDTLHRTERGRIVALADGDRKPESLATRQFEIADVRSPMEVAERIRRAGCEPVWKDWDMVLTG